MTYTKTFTILQVSQSTVDDIKERLIKAVGEAYSSDYLGRHDDKELIHLDGVALEAEPKEEVKPIPNAGIHKAWKPSILKPLVGVKLPPESGWRCQFCGQTFPQAQWKEGDVCPGCGEKYDAMLAQESEE